MNIEGMGIQIVEQLFQHKLVLTSADFYRLTYDQLIEELKKRYSDGTIIENSSEFDPAQMTINDVILIQKPFRNETFWNYLKSHTSVVQTVDLYDVGLVFFKPICPKQNFYLRKM